MSSVSRMNKGKILIKFWVLLKKTKKVLVLFKIHLHQIIKQFVVVTKALAQSILILLFPVVLLVSIGGPVTIKIMF